MHHKHYDYTQFGTQCVVRSSERCTLLRHASPHTCCSHRRSRPAAHNSNANQILHFYLVLINDLIQLGSSYTTNYMVLNIIVVAHLSAFKLFYIIRSECGGVDEPCNPIRKEKKKRKQTYESRQRPEKRKNAWTKQKRRSAMAHPTTDKLYNISNANAKY